MRFHGHVAPYMTGVLVRRLPSSFAYFREVVRSVDRRCHVRPATDQFDSSRLQRNAVYLRCSLKGSFSSILKTPLARDKICTRFCTSLCEKSEICWICEIAAQRVFKNLRLISYLQNGSSVRVLPEEPFFSTACSTLTPSALFALGIFQRTLRTIGSHYR
jgi:hypothetical protein